VKESDVGGEAGKKIARLGIKAVVLEDLPERAGTKVFDNRIESTDPFRVSELKEKHVSETIQLLRKRFGNQVASFALAPQGR